MFSSVFLNIILGILANAITQEEEIKYLQIEKKEMSFFIDGIIVYVKISNNK